MYPKGVKDPYEWERQAKQIATGEIIASPKEIISWLKDGNWPGAHIIADYLRKLPHEQLAEAVQMVFKSGDEEWIYFVNNMLLRDWSKEDIKSILRDDKLFSLFILDT